MRQLKRSAGKRLLGQSVRRIPIGGAVKPILCVPASTATSRCSRASSPARGVTARTRTSLHHPAAKATLALARRAARAAVAAAAAVRRAVAAEVVIDHPDQGHKRPRSQDRPDPAARSGSARAAAQGPHRGLPSQFRARQVHALRDEAMSVIAPQYRRRTKLVRDQRADRRAARNAERSARRSACDHDFQKHPSNAAISVCSKCGEPRRQ